MICAIGAYYTSLPGARKEDTSHEIYYLQALSIALPSGMDRSVEHVSLLLAQCFYLLAVGRTDRLVFSPFRFCYALLMPVSAAGYYSAKPCEWRRASGSTWSKKTT